jgi:hypothetical protein
LVLLLFFVLFFHISNINTPGLPLAKNNGFVAPSRVGGVRDMAVASNGIVGAVGTKGLVATDKKIVKTLTMSIEVANLDKAKNSVEEYVRISNGLIDSFYSYDFYNKIAYNYFIRIPTDRLDAFTKFLKTKGDVKSESCSSVDQTENYTDNESRLKNLYLRRDSLRNMMTKKAVKLADVISVEKELNNVQSEIERFEKSKQKMQRSVDYSSVNLTLTPEVIFENDGDANWKLKKSFNKAVNLLIKFYQRAVDFVVIIVVFLPPFALLFIVYRIFVLHRKKSK